MRSLSLATAATLFALCGSAQAWHVEVRFVERIGTTDVVILENELFNNYGYPRQIRLQIGVFDDADGPAPAGGLFGMVDVSCTAVGMVATRTPGRLPLFAFPPDGNGEPASDPFRTITGIDALRSDQTLVWNCSGAEPEPQPTAVIRGVNQYVSVYALTVVPNQQCGSTLTFSGSVVAAGGWSVVGSPVAPACTNPPSPGSVTYTAATLAPLPFTAQLSTHIHHGPPNPSDPIPGCLADWNHDLSLDSNDLFAYLTDFFADNGDTDCNHVTNSADFFLFLETYLSNCL